METILFTWVLGVGWTISVQKEAHVTFVLVKVSAMSLIRALSSLSSTSSSSRRRVEFFKRLCMDLIPSWARFQSHRREIRPTWPFWCPPSTNLQHHKEFFLSDVVVFGYNRLFWSFINRFWWEFSYYRECLFYTVTAFMHPLFSIHFWRFFKVVKKTSKMTKTWGRKKVST